MAGNLNVAVTADITDIRSKFVVLQQVSKDTNAAIRAGVADGKALGLSYDEIATKVSPLVQKQENLRSTMRSLTQAANELEGANRQMGQATVAAGQQVETAHAGMAHSGGVTREVLVMMHETLMGNYTRLGGSTVVLAERTNVLHGVIQMLSPAMFGAVGGVLALAGAFVTLAIRAHEANVAVNEAVNTAVLLGQSGPAAKAQVTALAESLKETGYIGHAAAYQIAGAIQQLPDVTAAAKAKIDALAPGFFVVFNEDAKKTAEEMGKIFQDTSSLEAYLNKFHVLDVEQTKTWNAATTDAAKFDVGIAALTDRLAGPIARYKELNDQATAAQANATLGVQQSAIVGPQNSPIPPANLGEADTGQKAPDPSIVQDYKNTLALNGANEERIRLNGQIQAAERMLASASAAGNAADAKTAQSAIDVGRARLAALTDPAQQAAYARYTDMAREADNAAVVSAAAAGKKRVEVTEAGLRAEIAVYQKAAQDESLSEKQRTDAHAQAVRLSISLTKDDVSARTAGASKGFEAEVARYNAEIAAAKGNADEIMALERQKLDFIRSARGEASREYQEALKEETTAVGQAVQQQVRAIEEGGKRKIADQAATLKEELATQQITKAEEASQLLQFVQTERDQELQALDTLKSTLTEGTVAYKEATDARTRLIQSFGTQLKNLNAESAGDGIKAADKFTESWLSDFSRINSAGEQAFTGLVTGQMTMQRAEQEVTKAILTSFIQLGTQLAERWLVTELAMTSTSTTQAAVRNAQESAISNTGFSVLLAKWFATETAKTDASVTGAATRAGVATGETATEEAGLLTRLGHWISAELGMTSATVTGAVTQTAATAGSQSAQTAAVITGVTARETAQTSAALAGHAVQAATGASTVMGDAAKAFSGTYSSVAQIPYVGPYLAPVAAAAAFAAVAAYSTLASMDVGTPNVTRDMTARIHKGEMILPRTFAEGVRSGDVTIGGGPSGWGLPTSIMDHINGGGARADSMPASMRGGDTTNTGGAITINHSPTFTGAPAQLSAQARRAHGDLVNTVMGALRNGQLRVPGRS